MALIAVVRTRVFAEVKYALKSVHPYSGKSRPLHCDWLFCITVRRTTRKSSTSPWQLRPTLEEALSVSVFNFNFNFKLVHG